MASQQYLPMDLYGTPILPPNSILVPPVAATGPVYRALPSEHDIIYTALNGWIIAVQINNGREVWRMNMGSSPMTLLAEGRYLYVATGAEFVILDSLTGAQLGKNPLTGLGYGVCSITLCRTSPSSHPTLLVGMPSAATVGAASPPNLMPAPGFISPQPALAYSAAPGYGVPLMPPMSGYPPLGPFPPQAVPPQAVALPPITPHQSLPLSKSEETQIKTDAQLAQELQRQFDQEYTNPATRPPSSSAMAVSAARPRPPTAAPPPGSSNPAHSSPLLPLEHLVFLGMNGRVLALNRFTAAEVWRNELPGTGYHPVTVSFVRGNLLAGTNGRLIGLNPLSGQELWRNELPGLGRNWMSLTSTGERSDATFANYFGQ